jgi:hypothetical protein
MIKHDSVPAERFRAICTRSYHTCAEDERYDVEKIGDAPVDGSPIYRISLPNARTGALEWEALRAADLESHFERIT